MKQILTTPPNAMAFYHPDGLVPAFQQAKEFAGSGGRIATMPEIIAARMVTEPGSVPWERYFTTLSAEYVGLAQDGTPIAVVIHRGGPMFHLQGILDVYKHHYRDKTRTKRGGRIPEEVFWALANGELGEVQVVNLRETWDRRDYAFSNHPIGLKEVEEEPLWQARLGPQWKEYCERHVAFATEWYEKQNKEVPNNPCILGMDCASNCFYSSEKLMMAMLDQSSGTAIGHLLSIGSLSHSHHQYYPYHYNDSQNRTSLSCDVSPHEWSNGVRFAAIREGIIGDIHPGIDDITHMMAKNWSGLMRPSQSGPSGFYTLMNFGDQVFAQVPKNGERMDTYEPEFRIVQMTKVGEGPDIFRTTIGGYHGFFKYGVREVQDIAPRDANAFLLPGEVEIECQDGDPTHHTTPIEFYHVEVDHSQRMLTRAELWKDFSLLMQLLDVDLDD